MKALNQSATRVLLSLMKGLNEGQARKVDNAKGAYMAVSCDVLRRTEGRALVAVAHRFEQNGDLCPDPDVEFLLVNVAGEVKAYPTAIDQTLGYRRVATVDATLNPETFKPAAQRDVAAFCNVWMRNVAAQQGIKGETLYMGIL